MKDAFLQSIRDEYPNELVTRLVFADWCLENLPELENKLRIHVPIIDGLDIYPNHGCPFEYGQRRVRYGRGNGYAYGYGIGRGIGFGYGLGFGDGFKASVKYRNPKINMPKLHTNQLLFLTFGFVFCGFIQEHIQPYQFKVTNASIILAHDSSWNEVANNTNRNINTRKFDTITIGPQIFTSMDWIGDLP